MQDQNKNMDLLINLHRTAISLEPTNQKKKKEAWRVATEILS